MLAPHLQLSLNLLQAATLELRDLVKQELEKNPTLEEIPQETVSLNQPDAAAAETPRDGRVETENEFREEFEALKNLDDEWRDYFSQSSRNRARNTEEEERRQFVFDSVAQPESLQDHLVGQLGMSEPEEDVRRVAEIIINSLNDDGYLLVHDEIGEEVIDLALGVCAGSRQASFAIETWARTLIESQLAKPFDRSKRNQIIGWRERLQSICQQMLKPESETKPPASDKPDPPATSTAAGVAPIKENIIEAGREAIEQARQELAEAFRAVINNEAPLPVPQEVLAEVFGTGASAGEITAALQPGQRLDLALLFSRPGPEILLETMRRGLELVQTFHPIGVGARTLRECLLIQLARLDKTDSLEARIVRDHFGLLAEHDVPKLAAALCIAPEEAQQALDSIGRLDPKPGRMFNTEADAYIEPEVAVLKDKDGFIVVLNEERIPHLRISDSYRQMMSQENASSEVVNYVRERIQAGKFLIRSIYQRQQTIQDIAQEIVRIQREFFEKGPAFLRPLRMSDVAWRCGEKFRMVNGVEKVVCPYCGALADINEAESNRRSANCPNAELDDFNQRRHRARKPGKEVDNPRLLGVHETTVSRAMANKYMATPHGVFGMKYFFTPGYAKTGGEAITTKTVKDLVKELVDGEDPARPLSDQELVVELKKRGLEIARRTVAKYRGELKIPPSNLRAKPGAAASPELPATAPAPESHQTAPPPMPPAS